METMKEFEKIWLDRLEKSLDKVVSEEIRMGVIQGSEELLENYSEANAITWTQEAMHRLESLVDHTKVSQVMTGCACHYPHEQLQDLKAIYAQTGSIDQVHTLLQGRFEREIKEYKILTDEQLAYIVSKGWGVAGRKNGDLIYATKIPSKFHEYIASDDPKEKRYCYCHCPRIREVLRNGEDLPVNYCYCGAGFYQDIWEEILQRPVKIEIVQSLLKGDEVCRFRIDVSGDSKKSSG